MPDPVIKYTGNGNDHHVGIPMRDLSGAEYDALDAEQRAIVRASPVFDYGAYRDATKKQRDRADAKAAKEAAAVADAAAADMHSEEAPMMGDVPAVGVNEEPIVPFGA